MRRALALGIALALLGGGLSACSEPPAETIVADAGAPVARSEAATGAPAAASAAPRAAATAHGRVAIPAGVVLAGSRPGTPFRRPSREADELPVAIPAFEIDRLPYPGDPLAPPRLVASRAEAAALCGARGGRLCSELEWERACEGDAHHAYPGGAPRFDADACSRDARACASALGVERVGEVAPEWTSSDVPERAVRGGRSAVQRGAHHDAAPELHRCDARTFEVPEDAARAAFRCCYGAPPSAGYPAIPDHPDFRALAVDRGTLRDTIREALRAVPELAPFADDFEPYGEAEGDRALACAGADRRALAGWELATGPFEWSPSYGEEAWVVAGHGAGSTLIAVLLPLPGGGFAHGGSFVLEGEDLPIAIAHTPPSRGELQWSACWGRPGDGGVVRFGDDAVIRVLSR